MSEEGTTGRPWFSRWRGVVRPTWRGSTSTRAEIDPEFGVELVDGTATPVDSTFSYAVGEVTQAAGRRGARPGVRRLLPDVHTCE